MRYGRVIGVQPEGVFVNIGQVHQKPMQIPKGMIAEVGDWACVEQIGGVWIVINVYGGGTDG